MSPGRKRSRSPASTAGRDRTMRSTSLRSNNCTAWATASQVLPVPAGPGGETRRALLASEQFHRMGDAEPSLAGAGGTGGEDERVALERAHVSVLRRRACAHAP